MQYINNMYRNFTVRFLAILFALSIAFLSVPTLSASASGHTYCVVAYMYVVGQGTFSNEIIHDDIYDYKLAKKVAKSYYPTESDEDFYFSYTAQRCPKK